jgi:predicted amidohydrolase YtcJ
MRVSELIKLLQQANPDAEVLIVDNGSILATGPAEDTVDYNQDGASREYFVVTAEW